MDADEAPVEPFLTRQQLSEVMGVSIGTIDNLRREGMPSTTWGKRTRRFRASAAIAWAESRTTEAGGE